jgi:hypothetical protein
VQDCYKAGETKPVLPPDPNYSSEKNCCAGLVEIEAAEQYGDVCAVGAGVMLCSDCGNGICEQWENNCNCQEDCPYNDCIDSDGGKDYYEKGTTYNENIVYVDSCTKCTANSEGSSSTTCFSVIEYYCSSQGIDSVTYVCPDQCVNGACFDECVEEGQLVYSSLPDTFDCCSGLEIFGRYNIIDSIEVYLDGAPGICYDPTKGEPVCGFGNDENVAREGWYYPSGELLRLDDCNKNTICPTYYDPVCGVPPFECPIGLQCSPAAQTYSNICRLNAAGAFYLYDGPCGGEGPEPSPVGQ